MMSVDHALKLFTLEGPGLKTSAFQWTWPSGSSPPVPGHHRFRSASSPAPPPELRLPVGLALGLEIARLRKEESRSTTSIYIGREGLRKQTENLAVSVKASHVSNFCRFVRSSRRVDIICRTAHLPTASAALLGTPRSRAARDTKARAARDTMTRCRRTARARCHAAPHSAPST